MQEKQHDEEITKAPYHRKIQITENAMRTNHWKEHRLHNRKIKTTVRKQKQRSTKKSNKIETYTVNKPKLYRQRKLQEENENETNLTQK